MMMRLISVELNFLHKQFCHKFIEEKYAYYIDNRESAITSKRRHKPE